MLLFIAYKGMFCGYKITDFYHDIQRKYDYNNEIKTQLFQ